jgi:hypothetical protein
MCKNNYRCSVAAAVPVEVVALVLAVTLYFNVYLATLSVAKAV